MKLGTSNLGAFCAKGTRQIGQGLGRCLKGAAEQWRSLPRLLCFTRGHRLRAVSAMELLSSPTMNAATLLLPPKGSASLEAKQALLPSLLPLHPPASAYPPMGTAKGLVLLQ